VFLSFLRRVSFSAVNTTLQRRHDVNTYRADVGYNSNFRLCISPLRPNDLPSPGEFVLKRSATALRDLQAVDN